MPNLCRNVQLPPIHWNCVHHIVFCWLNVFRDNVASGFLHGIESKPLSHDADTVPFGHQNYIAKASKYIPHLHVWSNPGRDEVDMTRRLYFKEKDRFSSNNDIGDNKVSRRYAGCLKSFWKGILWLNSVISGHSIKYSIEELVVHPIVFVFDGCIRWNTRKHIEDKLIAGDGSVTYSEFDIPFPRSALQCIENNYLLCYFGCLQETRLCMSLSYFSDHS
jgi:hypothetical protein